MLVYLALIVIFGLVIAVVSALISVPAALGFRRIFREMSVESLSMMASGVVPVFLMLVVMASFLSDDGTGGAAAQGLLIIAGISFVATMIGWPLGYRFSHRVLVGRSA